MNEVDKIKLETIKRVLETIRYPEETIRLIRDNPSILNHQFNKPKLNHNVVVKINKPYEIFQVLCGLDYHNLDAIDISFNEEFKNNTTEIVRLANFFIINRKKNLNYKISIAGDVIINNTLPENKNYINISVYKDKYVEIDQATMISTSINSLADYYFLPNVSIDKKDLINKILHDTSSKNSNVLGFSRNKSTTEHFKCINKIFNNKKHKSIKNLFNKSLKDMESINPNDLRFKDILSLIVKVTENDLLGKIIKLDALGFDAKDKIQKLKILANALTSKELENIGLLKSPSRISRVSKHINYPTKDIEEFVKKIEDILKLIKDPRAVASMINMMQTQNPKFMEMVSSIEKMNL